MGTEVSFLKPVLTNSQFLQKHIQYTLLCMLGLAQSSEGWTWYVKRVLCPGIRGLEQESFITSRWPLPNLGFPSLHLLPGPASPNLSVPPFPVQTNFQSFSRRRPSHGATQLKPSLPWNIEDGGVSRGHCGRKASSNWQKWGSSIGYTLQIVVLSGDRATESIPAVQTRSCCRLIPEIAHVPENTVQEWGP